MSESIVIRFIFCSVEVELSSPSELEMIKWKLVLVKIRLKLVKKITCLRKLAKIKLENCQSVFKQCAKSVTL